MPTARHFLLVEGVNLDDNIYDTDQLSVIRGTSFLYKQAIEAVGKISGLTAISTGASSGLFAMGDSVNDPDHVLETVWQCLADKGEKFGYLTFQVAHCQADSLLVAKERLYTQLRFQQLQSLTLQPDMGGEGANALYSIPCGLTGSRIAALHEGKIQSDDNQRISRSVHDRWLHGRDQKQSFYTALVTGELSQVLGNIHFAKDIEALCEDSCQRLNNKMAVFYVDGNSFSLRQQSFIGRRRDIEGQIELQEQFDQAIQGQRSRFLTETLQCLLPRDGSNTIRLETLLWGGDEMLFVMPAWEGFDFLQRFFAFPWELPDGEAGANRPLTHAAGIVFCQAKTPIRIIRQLANSLADGVKAAMKAQGITENGWDYVVLESVDYPTNERLDGYFVERYGSGLEEIRPHWLPVCSGWGQQKKEMAAFLAGQSLSRGQLYQLVQAVKQQYPLVMPTPDKPPTLAKTRTWADVLTTPDNPNPQEQAERRMFEVSEDQDSIRLLPQQAAAWFGVGDFDDPCQRAWFWIHLLELWGYLIPQTLEGKAA